MRHVPYRRRLTFAYTAIFALALLAFSLIAYATVRLMLHAQLNAALAMTATALRSVPDVHDRALAMDQDDRNELLAVVGENHVNGLIIDSGGRVLVSNRAHPPREVLGVRTTRPLQSGNVRIDGETIAYAGYPIVRQGRTYGSIVIWASRSADENVARTTLLALLGASVVVIVGALLAGGALMRRMLRPVSDLSAMMADIEATDLSARLAWDGPRDELGRLCTTFDRLLDRLERAFESERRFTADASHELRTPIAVLRAELELALTRDREPDEYRAVLARLRNETARLELLTESLLLSARQEAIAAPPAPIDVTAAVERAALHMAPLLHQRKVTFAATGDEHVTALADGPAIERVLIALLDNALRFSPAGGTIQVQVTGPGDAVAIAVTDEGSGFSEVALREATRRFWREDPSRSGPGTGLGLAIVRATVEGYGGSVTLENAKPHGAIVTVRLPRAGRPSRSFAGT